MHFYCFATSSLKGLASIYIKGCINIKSMYHWYSWNTQTRNCRGCVYTIYAYSNFILVTSPKIIFNPNQQDTRFKQQKLKNYLSLPQSSPDVSINTHIHLLVTTCRLLPSPSTSFALSLVFPSNARWTVGNQCRIPKNRYLPLYVRA